MGIYESATISIEVQLEQNSQVVILSVEGAKAEAWTLARQADETAARLYGSYMSPLPRFDSFVSGGHIVPAIQ